MPRTNATRLPKGNLRDHGGNKSSLTWNCFLDDCTGSTMFAPTVTMDKIPTLKIARLKKPLVIQGFFNFLGVVSSDDKANPVESPI